MIALFYSVFVMISCMFGVDAIGCSRPARFIKKILSRTPLEFAKRAGRCALVRAIP